MSVYFIHSVMISFINSSYAPVNKIICFIENRLLTLSEPKLIYVYKDPRIYWNWRKCRMFYWWKRSWCQHQPMPSSKNEKSMLLIVGPNLPNITDPWLNIYIFGNTWIFFHLQITDIRFYKWQLELHSNEINMAVITRQSENDNTPSSPRSVKE